ncbi:ATP phosphoribosyltransferase regulatory subunit [Hydrogenovibrio sp. SC-1]|uniref:ATP phosphoribosyltransferase regulatory subunit n=1 Tax=Hydrogenovibrio sp. SC-1 TaxID=2065820 RepID=UPI000C7E09FB|nr:ATP phosphoribosyltransferase regulatory subunit [Hydrogenovibrio sp. SC-1]PLA74910.1 ATP phosphoribosyltransferase regulatory subunit [Hydrogenovibrio sp. SC-1]
MQQNIWFTPDGIEDLLPDAAKKLEFYRRQLLDQFELAGYDLVLPPLAEFTDSLLTGKGQHLAVDTCRFTDQESGKMMGVRADMTPQVARIAINRLKQSGIVRLCYVGEVLKTRNNKAKGSRSPIEIGAELFGHSGVESDIEVIELMLASLRSIGLSELTLSLGHVAIVDELMRLADLSKTQQQLLVDILLRKSLPEYQAFIGSLSVSAELEPFFDVLPSMCGDAKTVIEQMQSMKVLSEKMKTHLCYLEDVLQWFGEFTGLTIHVDLADLRGYQYHTGMIFSCYASGRKLYQLARGGRYDGIGSEFGTAQLATGFSLDLRGTLDLLALPEAQAKRVVFAPNQYDQALNDIIESLKQQNCVVKRMYQFEDCPEGGEYLTLNNGQWILQTKNSAA